MSRRPDPPLHWQSVSAESVCGRFTHFSEAGREQRATPFRSERRFTPRLCLSSRTSYPLPRVSSDFAGGSRSFPVQFSVGTVHPSVYTAQKAHSVSSIDSEGSVVPEAGSESRASYPLRSRERVHTPPLLAFEGQLPPPARVVSTDLEGDRVSFRRRFSGAGTLFPYNYSKQTRSDPDPYTE